MNSKSKKEIEELQKYRNLCDKLMYSIGNNELPEAINELENLRTEKAVNVLIKCLMNHPEGRKSTDVGSPRAEAALPSLRMWDITPEKIIPIIPNILKEIWRDKYGWWKNDAEEILTEMNEEMLLTIYNKGINDYDRDVRAATISFFPEMKATKEILMYRTLCDALLYGNQLEAVKKLEELKTETAIDLLIKCILEHPEGKFTWSQSTPRSEAALPLLRLWKIAQEKIISVIPEMLKFEWWEPINYEEYQEIFNEMSKETLLQIFTSGLNDYDRHVRTGTACYLPKKIIKEILSVLIETYQLETVDDGYGVQSEIEGRLLHYLNEEIAEVLIDLLKNYQIRENKTFYFEMTYDITEEQIQKTVPIFLRKWAEEKDVEYQKSIEQIIIDLVTPFAKNIDQLLTKEDLKQLQTLGIIKS